jgi:ribosome-associated translation inhibitor RaiA
MNNSDTVKLLRECDAGTKMAVAAIDEVHDKLRNQRLKRLLDRSKHHHGALGNKIHRQLVENGSTEKDPPAMAKGMAWIKTTLKMGMEESDATAADLITDGCGMGIKSLSRYLNQYRAADRSAKNLCRQLVRIEEKLASELRPYL